MNKHEAIQKINEIRDGITIDRNKYPESMRGSVANHVWDDSKFSYGMEYGYILGLMEAFNITEEDLYDARSDS